MRPLFRQSLLRRRTAGAGVGGPGHEQPWQGRVRVLGHVAVASLAYYLFFHSSLAEGRSAVTDLRRVLFGGSLTGAGR